MLDVGKIQSQIVDHIEAIDKTLSTVNASTLDSNMVITGLMQAKSIALVALSNTRSQVYLNK
ncbi:hypothetical protein D3C79_806730 [compost metagenome]